MRYTCGECGCEITGSYHDVFDILPMCHLCLIDMYKYEFVKEKEVDYGEEE